MPKTIKTLACVALSLGVGLLGGCASDEPVAGDGSEVPEAVAVPEPDCAAVASLDPAFRAGAVEGLRALLGDQACAATLTPMGGGLSGKIILKIASGEGTWVLKLFPPNLPGVQGAVQACKLASAAGVAPAVRYTAPDFSVVIEDFLAGESLAPSMMASPESLAALGRTLSDLHGAEGEYPARRDPFADIREHMNRARTAHAALPSRMADALVAIDRIEAACDASGVPDVPLHNDLNPRNILRRDGGFVLVDWSDAALGDAFYDLGFVACLQCLDEPSQKQLLDGYGASGSAAEAHLRLMQQVVLLDTATKLLASAAEVRRSSDPPTPEAVAAADGRLGAREFEPFCTYAEQFAQGTLDLSTAEGLEAIGLSALHEFLKGVDGADFTSDLAVLER